MSKDRTKSPSLEKPFRNVALLGLFRRKEKWTLSTRGKLVCLSAATMLGIGLLLGIHPFLAITDRVDTRYLVIEGWVPNYALEEGIAEFKSRPYTMIFTVGADPLSQVDVAGDSQAIDAAKRLRHFGMSPDLVQAVPARVKYRNRTFQSAVALRKWFEEKRLPITSLNVITLGTHARRSRLLFEEAFDRKTRIGIISVEDREYNPKQWWKFSAGVRQVMSETISYLYVRFFFYPGKE